MGSANAADPRLQILTTTDAHELMSAIPVATRSTLPPTNRISSAVIVMQLLRDFLCLLDAIYNDLKTECNNICVTLRDRGQATTPRAGAHRDFQAQFPSRVPKKPAPDFAAEERRYAGRSVSRSKGNPVPKPYDFQ